MARVREGCIWACGHALAAWKPLGWLEAILPPPSPVKRRPRSDGEESDSEFLTPMKEEHPAPFHQVFAPVGDALQSVAGCVAPAAWGYEATPATPAYPAEEEVGACAGVEEDKENAGTVQVAQTAEETEATEKSQPRRFSSWASPRQAA